MSCLRYDFSLLWGRTKFSVASSSLQSVTPRAADKATARGVLCGAGKFILASI